MGQRIAVLESRRRDAPLSVLDADRATRIDLELEPLRPLAWDRQAVKQLAGCQPEEIADRGRVPEGDQRRVDTGDVMPAVAYRLVDLLPLPGA